MRRRVVVQAFACCPPGAAGFEGGEDLLGWMLVCELSRFNDVWVLTHPRRRTGIEGARPVPAQLHVVYVALSQAIEWWLRLPGLHQAYYYLWQFAAWWRARTLHRTIRFDLAHHLTYANDWMGSMLGAWLPVPFIRGPGGGAQRVPPRFLRLFSPVGQCWERLRGLGQWGFRHDPLFLRGQARARALLVCTREALDQVPRRWRGKAEIFPVNGISDADLAALEAGPRDPSQPFRVVSAGKLLRLKGFALAIDAFAAFHATHPEAVFDIYGAGPDADRLKRRITRHGLEDCVALRPWLPRQELLEALRGCDVFLFPSLRDGGGAVVVEAMAAGKPVVCLDLGGPGTHIQPGLGLKVHAGDPQQAVAELAQALERLAQDAALRERVGAAARAQVIRAYRWPVLGRRLRELYDAAAPRPDATDPQRRDRVGTPAPGVIHASAAS